MLRVEFVVLAFTVVASAQGPDARELVRQSVVNNDRNWKAAPDFSFQEEDVVTEKGQTTRKTYRVVMIEGSPYNELVARNGEPLKPEQAAAEQKKLAGEKERRRAESPSSRAKRVEQYARERRQDHALMTEMVQAFDFRVTGRESVEGRDCWVLEATPKSGYQPHSRETKVLTGMRGRMWIDSREHQWVRVHAEVFRPVAFGLFIAHVQPGTEFTLDEAPVESGVWMPSRLVTKVHATVLRVWSKNSSETDRFWDYHRATAARASANQTEFGHR
jgi:hypothetical protein